jgi:hypothetical protein
VDSKDGLSAAIVVVITLKPLRRGRSPSRCAARPPIVRPGLANIVGAGATIAALGAALVLAAARYGARPSEHEE